MGVDRDVEIALCVFREANDALIVFDPRDRKVVDLNPAALRLTGLDKKAALGVRIADLLSSPDPDDFKRLLEACQFTSFFHSKEGYFLARQGRPPLPVNVSLSRIHTSPEPLALAIIRDISERKLAEAELRQARDELELRVRERTAELRDAKEAAEAAGRVKDRFLAVLSHELRTPLTPVLAIVSALLDDPGTSNELRTILEMIRRSITLEARLIDDLLDVTRAGQDKLRFVPELVDAHGLIEQTLELCRHEAADGVRIVVDLGARDHTIEADPTRFQQVVWNLLKNAMKFTKVGETITVATRDRDDGRLVVTVADDGRGIEPEVLPRIFEPFEQGQTSTHRRLDGLGLGLSICRSIVEGHGGQLTAASEGPGRGASFTFDFAVARLPDSTPGTIPSTPSADPEPARRGASLLLVEDNKDVLRYLRLVLEMRGYRVTTATDVASARALFDPSLDLMSSDIELPDGSGLDLMREFRDRVPGIAISGFGAPDDIQMSLNAGFNRHLTKPVETARLEAAILEVIAASGRGAIEPIPT